MREQTPVDRLSRAYRKEFGPWEWREDDERSVLLIASILVGAGILGSIAGYVLASLALML